jgi:hypothetical protein
VVVGIVVGLLAMHTIASGMTGHSEPSTAAMVMTPTHHDAAPAVEECDAGCAPVHDMTAMVCVLALMLGSFLLVVGLLVGALSRAHRAWFRSIPETIRAVRSAPFPHPPDLLKLSISRT